MTIPVRPSPRPTHAMTFDTGLIWTQVLGVLLGQADGKVFISEAAVTAIDRFELVVERDYERHGWHVWIRPAPART